MDEEEIQDVSRAVDDDEHPAFLCLLCDNPMTEDDHTVVVTAIGYKCLVHSACAFEESR